MRLIAVSVLLAGCGRLNFSGAELSDGGTARGDGVRLDAAADGVLATTCGTNGAMACDGFEAGTLDPMWTLDTSAGTITVDTARAYRGSSSAHVHINQITSAITNPRASLLGPAGLQSAVTGMIYFRVWMYVASPLDSTAMFNQMVNASDVPGNGISMGSRHGVVTNNDYTDALYGESATAFPLDRWTCVQFEVPSNIAGTTRTFIDGTELTDIALTKATVQPPPAQVYLGLEWVGNPNSMPAADAWLDEIIVDTQPTTCAQ